MLPTSLENTTNKNIIQMIDFNPNVVFLLVYAAHIDTHISSEEKELIMNHLNDAEQWQDILKQFKKMNEKEKADRALDILTNASETEKESWLKSVNELLQADGRFRAVEKLFIRLLKK